MRWRSGPRRRSRPGCPVGRHRRDGDREDPEPSSMSRELEIRSSEGDTRLVFTGEIPPGVSGENGCSYDVALRGRPVAATVAVYDIQPRRWAEFFGDLARSWRGWSGEKSQASLEGHL